MDSNMFLYKKIEIKTKYLKITLLLKRDTDHSILPYIFIIIYYLYSFEYYLILSTSPFIVILLQYLLYLALLHWLQQKLLRYWNPLFQLIKI